MQMGGGFVTSTFVELLVSDCAFEDNSGHPLHGALAGTAFSTVLDSELNNAAPEQLSKRVRIVNNTFANNSAWR